MGTTHLNGDLLYYLHRLISEVANKSPQSHNTHINMDFVGDQWFVEYMAGPLLLFEKRCCDV